MFAARKMMMGGKKNPVLESATAATTGGASTTYTIPATTGAIGRLQVLIISHHNVWTVTPPSGWTKVLDTAYSPSTSIFWRVVTADDVAAQVFTFSGSANYRSYASLIFRNAVFDAVGAYAASSTTTIVAPTITAKKGLLCAVGSTYATAGSATWSVPSGMTEYARTESHYLDLVVFGQAFAGGSTGTRTLTNSYADAKNAVLFSIKGK